MLMACGAVFIERWTARSGRAWLRPAYGAVIALSGALIGLSTLPLLPPQTYIAYTRLMGFSEPKFENRKASALPQFLADRWGWPEMAAATAKVYNELPPDQRAKTAIFGSNYGEAGAIDFYGPALGLPKAISGHANYWYWGPRDYTGESMIVLCSTCEQLYQAFAKVEAKGTVGNPYAMANENFTIYLCTQPKYWHTLQDVWPKLKNWN